MSILTIKEIAEKYRVCHTTVINWTKKGLPFTKIGKLYRIKEEDLQRYISVQNERDSFAQVGGDTEK